MSTPPRAAEIRVRDRGRQITERWIDAAPGRLSAVLFRDPPGETDASPVVGGAWIDDTGGLRWGWPADDGAMPLRAAPAGGWQGCLLPTALALALSMRRRGTELGQRACVLGTGVAADIAMAVARTLGCRVTQQDGREGSTDRPDWGAPIVIEASGTRANLEAALAGCEDWGVVYSMAGGLASSPLDYYTDVHRRALSVCRVPDLPVLAPGEDDLVDRGAAVLLPALERTLPSAPETRETVVVQPGDRIARLVRDPSGLCLVRVAR